MSFWRTLSATQGFHWLSDETIGYFKPGEKLCYFKLPKFLFVMTLGCRQHLKLMITVQCTELIMD